MKKPMKLLLLAALVTGAAAAGIAYAKPGGEHCRHEGPGMAMGHGRQGMDMETRIERMADALDLSKEQRDQMRGIVDKARPAGRELRDRLHENRKQLRALMQQDKPVEADIRRLADSQGKAVADMIVLRSKVQADIRAILTPEQRQKMQERMGQHRGYAAMRDGQEPEWQSEAGAVDGHYQGEEKPLVKRVSM